MAVSRAAANKAPLPGAKTRRHVKDAFPWWFSALGMVSLIGGSFLPVAVPVLLGTVGLILLGAVAGDALPKKRQKRATSISLLMTWWAVSIATYYAIGPAAIALALVTISSIGFLIGWENWASKFEAGRTFVLARRKKELVFALRKSIGAYVEATRLPTGTKIATAPVVSPTHVEFKLQLPAGSPANIVAKGHPHAASSMLGLSPGSVRAVATDDNSQIAVSVMLSNPLKDPIKWPGLPIYTPKGDPMVRSAQGFMLGMARNGTPEISALEDNHFLIAGMSGSGKTFQMKAMALQAAFMGDVELHIYDTVKRGGDFGFIRHRCTVFVDNPNDAVEALENLYALMEQRYALIAARGRAGKWSTKTDGPRIVCFIDEAASVVRGKGSKERLQHLAAESRGAGITLVVATQTPQHQVFDVNTRRNLMTRLCFRVESEIVSEVVLGVAGVPAQNLPSGTGLYYLVGPGIDGVESARGFWLPDQTSDKEARRMSMITNAAVSNPEKDAAVLTQLQIHPVLAQYKYAMPVLRALDAADGPMSKAALCRACPNPVTGLPIDKTQIQPTLAALQRNPKLIENGTGGFTLTAEGTKTLRTVG